MANALTTDNSRLKPATVSTFIKRWGTAFNIAINNPSPWDYIGAGAGVTFGTLAKAMAAEGTAARLMDINVSNIGMVPSIAQSGAKNGASGAMAELGAGAVALLAGWGTDTTVTAGAVFLFGATLPETGIAAVALAAAASVSYLAGKAVTSGIDTFNALTRQASSSGQPIVTTLPDGATVTAITDPELCELALCAIPAYPVCELALRDR